MNEFFYSKAKENFCVQACGCRLNVFRVGGSPRLRASGLDEADAQLMKGIHTHFTYEVFFVVSGRLKLITEYAERTFPPSVLIIPPRTKHYSIPLEGESYCLLFSFAEKGISTENVEAQLEEEIAELPMTEEITFYIRRFTEKTLRNTEESENEAELLAALLFSAILSALRPVCTDAHRKKERAREHISTIESFINQNLDRKMTLADVAAAVYLSTRQVSRIIRREYQCSFSELLTDKRLAKACLLLKNTDMKIAEIAVQAFANTPAYFCCVFKARYGISPLTYRREVRLLDQQRS